MFSEIGTRFTEKYSSYTNSLFLFLIVRFVDGTLLSYLSYMYVIELIKVG